MEDLMILSSDSNYEKMSIKERIEFLIPFVEDILNVDVSNFLINKTIDFGMKRGQGKRSANMITGGMGSFYGPQTYYGVSITKYLNDFSENDKLLLNDVSDSSRYIKAREFGLGHKMSIAFSKFYYYGKFSSLKV